MVNDITTLNGSLQELGETMAENLTTMGVPSTYDEGLTTLAGKILEIQGGGSSFDDITLTEQDGKSILSYADGDSAVLVAQLVDENEEPVSVSGVSVSLYKDNVLWDTISTDGTGKVSKTYFSQGIGDIVFEAEVSGSSELLSKTYEVSDYWYYNHNDNTVFNNAPNVSGDYFVVSSNKEQIPLKNPIELPSEWKITYVMQKWGSSSNWNLVAIGETYTDDKYYDFGKLNANIGAIRQRNNIQVILSQFRDNCSTNTDYLVTITYQNGIYTLSYNGRSCTSTDDSIQPLFFLGIGIGSNAKIKDIIIEKL